MVYEGNKEGWFSPIAGIGVILIGTMAWTAFVFLQYWNRAYSAERASVLVGIGGVLATLGLALGIFYQAHQNEKLLDQNEDFVEDSLRQTVILQESEWMPDGVFNPNENRFRFTRNRPFSPKGTLEIENEVIDWTELSVSKSRPGDPNTDWIISLDDLLEGWTITQSGSFEGELELHFDSITGESYEYAYDVEIELRGTDVTVVDAANVSRNLPWDEVAG